MKDKQSKKVMIGMSGGVDSSVSAYILKEQGYNVTGATILMNSCHSFLSVEDAKKVCKILNIPHITFDLKKEFDQKVIQYFISEYLDGRTPNPCVVCNRYIKFEELLNKAVDLGMDFIATGHYAKVEKENGRYLLKKSSNQRKDQTYFLYNLTQEQLSKVLFPLEDLEKEDVRNIAKKLDLPTHNKPDSQEICFIKDNNYSKFIEENSDVEVKPGDIVDTKGNKLGKHNGIFNYTVGQRKGLGVPSNKALYVIEIDIEKNEVVVGDDSQGYSSELIAVDINLISIDELEKDMEVDAKIRYGAKESPATISPLENGSILVRFKTPQRAITPGQAVVFYNKEIVVGGGTIL